MNPDEHKKIREILEHGINGWTSEIMVGDKSLAELNNEALSLLDSIKPVQEPSKLQVIEVFCPCGNKIRVADEKEGND